MAADRHSQIHRLQLGDGEAEVTLAGYSPELGVLVGSPSSNHPPRVVAQQQVAGGLVDPGCMLRRYETSERVGESPRVGAAVGHAVPPADDVLREESCRAEPPSSMRWTSSTKTVSGQLPMASHSTQAPRQASSTWKAKSGSACVCTTVKRLGPPPARSSSSSCSSADGPVARG